jgi:hypothetical protein
MAAMPASGPRHEKCTADLANASAPSVPAVALAWQRGGERFKSLPGPALVRGTYARRALGADSEIVRFGKRDHYIANLVSIRKPPGREGRSRAIFG